MKDKAYVIWVYCIILFIGGFIGFMKTNSLVSLVTASLFAGMLARYAYIMWTETLPKSVLGYRMTIVFLVTLLAFFSYRLAMTHKMMPAGMMTLVTFAVLIYIWLKKSTLADKNNT